VSNQNERPILFTGAMVRAILDGSKIQTRRVVMPQPEKRPGTPPQWEWRGGKALIRAGYGADYVHTGYHHMIKAVERICPWKIGEVRWVRETWGVPYKDPDKSRPQDVIYRANPRDGSAPIKWRPSIFMPRWACRIRIQIVDVDIQRVQEIQEQEARAEGVAFMCRGITRYHGEMVQNFEKLWDSINKKRGFGWKVNPFVYAITFRKL
jgi:hypothetical protein